MPNTSKISIWALLLIAISLSGYYVYNTTYNRAIISFAATPPPAVHPTDSAAPVAIAIPSVNIDLPIEIGVIHNNIWSVSEFYANHLKTSAHPGTAGNIIVYGHDKPEIFESLRTVQLGDRIELTTPSGQPHVYEVTQIYTTTPNDTEPIAQTATETLTVYTCDGVFNEKRFIIRAQPV
ncbi:MAG: sortase [Candidatus Andersenbacteria bacterium]